LRVIARGSLVAFWGSHSEARPALERWLKIARTASWSSMNDVQAAFRNAKVLNAERARFEVHGGDYRLIVAFDFRRQIAFIKFIGTHKEYDQIDALTVAMF
jgi:mRNA interferase HigB